MYSMTPDDMTIQSLYRMQLCFKTLLRSSILHVLFTNSCFCKILSIDYMYQ